MKEETKTALPVRRQNSIVILLVTIALGIGVAASLFRSPSNQSRLPGQGSVLFKSLEIGQKAPDFTLKGLDGREIRLSSFTGRPVLINFWASWCVGCRAETPELVRAFQTHEAEGLIILGVNLTYLDTLPDIKAYIAEFKVPYPVLIDDTGEVANSYQVRAVPVSVFVDRQGIITHVQAGALNRELIEKYLAAIIT